MDKRSFKFISVKVTTPLVSMVRTIGRLLVWPMLIACYGTVLLAFVHWLTDTFSGIGFLSMAGVVFIGVPSLVGYGGMLWVQGSLQGIARIEMAACLTLPVILLALGSAIIWLGRLYAYFSPSWTAFQADRGRCFSVMVDGISN